MGKGRRTKDDEAKNNGRREWRIGDGQKRMNDKEMDE